MPSETVEKLQTSLQTKAKPDPAFRFYALWDKVCRKNGLREAYRRCSTNAGAAGVDSETYERIDTHGLERWLETLWEELRSGKYVPKLLLRVWIPKSNGNQAAGHPDTTGILHLKQFALGMIDESGLS